MIEPWIPHTVWTKTLLSDPSWSVPTGIYCRTLTRGVAPTLDQAQLVYRFGTIDGDYVTPIDLVGKYVRIAFDTPPVVWVGYVASESRERWPEESDGAGDVRVKGGDQLFTAVGLEWFLTRETMNFCWVYPANRIERSIGYNTGFGDGRDVEYAERGNRDGRSATLFAEDKDNAELWSARNIVDSLTADHGPKDDGGNDSPPFVLDGGQVNYLTWYYPIVSTEGHSVWQVLNEVIHQSRGLLWWTIYDEINDNVVLRVTSLAAANISMPSGGTLPAAWDQTALGDIADGNRRISYESRYDRRYDVVICRGARRRSVFTVSVGAGTLEKSWLDSEETEYKTAASSDDSKVNDRFRQASRFERVYSAFHLPQDWDGEVALGVRACPQFEQSTGSEIGAEPIHVPSLRLLRTLPTLVGWDYSDATNPTPRDPDNIRPEFQLPFGVVDVTKGGAGEWHQMHKLGVSSEDQTIDWTAQYTSFHLHVLEGTPGLQLRPSRGMPHILALDTFAPDTDAVSEFQPEWDYRVHMKCTVCGEWDAYCEGRWPAADPTATPLKRLYISIGDRARFDWLAEGTVYDAIGGSLNTVATPGALRDDRELCQDVARLAFEWYGVERKTIQISYETFQTTPDLGALITTIGTGAAQETANATVSQISYDLERGKMVLHAGFTELDFASL